MLEDPMRFQSKQRAASKDVMDSPMTIVESTQPYFVLFFCFGRASGCLIDCLNIWSHQTCVSHIGAIKLPSALSISTFLKHLEKREKGGKQ